MDDKLLEQDVKALIATSSRERRKKKRLIDNIGLILIVSWLFTGSCILFLFIGLMETFKPLLVFACLTVVLHIYKYSLKMEVVGLNEEYNKLLEELDSVRKRIRDHKHSERRNVKGIYNPYQNHERLSNSNWYKGYTSDVKSEQEDLRKIDQQLKIERNREEQE